MASTATPTSNDGQPPARRKAAERRMLEKIKKYQDQWDTLPDGAKQIAELVAIRKALQSEILDDDGNMISLWDYAINRELEMLSAETGFGRDTDEDPEDIIESKPGWLLRKNAPKMQLRESEEQNLGLDLMGQGFSAKFHAGHDIPAVGDFIPPRLDFAYGVFAKADMIQPLLERYADRPPAEMLMSERYYQDLLLHSPQLETTVMMVTTRDLPLANLQRNYIGKLMEQVRSGITFRHMDEKGEEQSEHLPCTKDDLSQADDLSSMFTPGVLKGLPFMSADGKNIKQDTKLILTTTPAGGFCVEVESPGTLSQQRNFYISDYTSKHLTYAMLDSFMGPNALDPVAQLDIGACFLYFANGFKFDSGEDDPRRIEESEELLQNSDLYFHPSGVMMAPEGQTVPGMKDMPGNEEDDEQERQDRAAAADAAGASAKGSGSTVSDSTGSVRQPQTAAAALTLSRQNFSLPQLGRRGRDAETGAVDSGVESSNGIEFRPREAVKNLLGHVGKLRLGWRDT